MSTQKNWHQICIGNRGRRIFLVSQSFWDLICDKYKGYNSKRKIGLFVEKLTNKEFKHHVIEQWNFSKIPKPGPIIIPDKEIPILKESKNYCQHGYKLFCPACNIYIKQIKNSPVPTIWKTHRKGKIYIYDKFWEELIKLSKEGKKIGVLNQQIAKITKLDQRGLRRWSNQNIKPKIYAKEEFNFTNPNLYWLGLNFSDGHIRNNGANLSYTYQVNSSNIFQGYWFIQFIQKYLEIFKHKEKESTTSIEFSNQKAWHFKTNLSGISPIFMELLKDKSLIKKRKDTKTSGFQKELTKEFLNNIKNKEILFQGIFDGDGHYSLGKSKSTNISLALCPYINHTDLIEQLPLVPTSCKLLNKKTKIYEKEGMLLNISFAPCSLTKLSSEYSPQNIVDQLEFMLKAAQHSIRPDKVHALIKIINRICSQKYGEYRNCFPIQRKIRDLANKRNLKEKVKQLERQYPIKDNKYLPFKPLWAKELCSKKEWFSEAWDFFFNLENLNFKNYPNKEKFNFEEGVPIDFKL